jgi:hypothetical protein
MLYRVRSLHLRGHLNQFSPPIALEFDLFRQMCQYGGLTQPCRVTNKFHPMVLCSLQEQFDNLSNVFGPPRSFLLEG